MSDIVSARDIVVGDELVNHGQVVTVSESSWPVGQHAHGPARDGAGPDTHLCITVASGATLHVNHNEHLVRWSGVPPRESVSINWGDWKPCGEAADPDYPERGNEYSRLLCTLVINGLQMHLEAWELAFQMSEGEPQQLKQMSDHDFDNIHVAVGSDGPFETINMGGREYVLIATPYCR